MLGRVCVRMLWLVVVVYELLGNRLPLSALARSSHRSAKHSPGIIGDYLLLEQIRHEQPPHELQIIIRFYKLRLHIPAP